MGNIRPFKRGVYRHQMMRSNHFTYQTNPVRHKLANAHVVVISTMVFLLAYSITTVVLSEPLHPANIVAMCFLAASAFLVAMGGLFRS
jgi:hypothetical protein